jgi:hypothetical protein
VFVQRQKKNSTGYKNNKTMKKLTTMPPSICLIYAIMALSCDSSADSFKEKNDPISFEIRTSDGIYDYARYKQYEDSVKIGQPRTVHFTLFDDMKELTLSASFDKGGNNVVIVLENDTIISERQYNVPVGKRMDINITGKSPGEVIGQLKFIDYYGESLSLPIYLFVFDNLYPVCKMDIKEVKELSEYEYLIDLSKSFDADAKFGGNIESYEYKIGNYYFLTTEKSSIYHIFPTTGAYDIKCRVKDNDGAWSDVVSTKVTI